MSSQVFTRRDGAEQSIKVMDASLASKSGGHDETVPTLHGLDFIYLSVNRIYNSTEDSPVKEAILVNDKRKRS